MHEIELKILLGPGQEEMIRKAPALARMAEGRSATQSLVSIYYDTADRALAGAGIALRLRKKGRRWLQTVKKSAAPIAGGLSQPLEDEFPVAGQNLAVERIRIDDLREEVLGLVRPGLEPVSETRFKRTTWMLRAPSGGLAEMAIDIGEVVAGGQSAPLEELELELKEGHPGALFAIAAELFSHGPVRVSNHAKSARAAMLAREGHAIEPLAPRNASPVALDAGMTSEEAARRVLGECLAHAMENVPVVVGSDDPEGPHQLRVGMRRLRSAISAFRPVLGREALARLADGAREIGALVGPLRDLDVMADEMLAAEAARAPEETGFTVLIDAIHARRDTVREAVRERLCDEATTRFGFESAGFLAGRGWLDPGDHGQTVRLARPVAKLAAKRLEARWKALSAYGTRIDTLDIDQRHEMRKEIKKMRYVVETFESLWPAGSVKGFRSALKTLQTAFGALNDVAMAETFLTAPDAPGAGDPLAQRAAGRLIGAAMAEADRLWPEARADWKALADQGPFWR